MEKYEAYVISRIAGMKVEFIKEYLEMFNLKELEYEKLYKIVKEKVEECTYCYDKKVPKREYSTFKKGINRLIEHKNSDNYKKYWLDYLGDLLQEDIK